MDKIDNSSFDQVVEAVLIWTGWQQHAFPRRDDSLVEIRFGKEVAAKLLPIIKSLEKDFYSSDAKWVAVDLKEMEKLSTDQFKRTHPGIADEIVKAFAWCYTFDFK
jgi:hypothetical protein